MAELPALDTPDDAPITEDASAWRRDPAYLTVIAAIEADLGRLRRPGLLAIAGDVLGIRFAVASAGAGHFFGANNRRISGRGRKPSLEDLRNLGNRTVADDQQLERAFDRFLAIAEKLRTAGAAQGPSLLWDVTALTDVALEAITRVRTGEPLDDAQAQALGRAVALHYRGVDLRAPLDEPPLTFTIDSPLRRPPQAVVYLPDNGRQENPT